MQQSDAPSKIRLAWAANGTKNTIPLASQISVMPGAASYNDGFPPLTMTPVVAGGIPPSGNDFNGILNALSAIDRWHNAGAGYVYDSAFAADTNVGGYPSGARVLRTDGQGYWLNTVDDNTTDPEALGAGWVPDVVYGSTSVVMSGSNVTLTALQAAKSMIVITGTLTANVNLILPAWVMEWLVVNNATGSYNVTVKTASGSGVSVAAGAQTRVRGDGTNIFDATSNATAAGAIFVHAGSSAPAGSLKANGAAVSRTTYAALFAAIGTAFGAGDGSTTFNLPDLRGEFVRGWDDGRGVDSGRGIGTAQADQMPSHRHGYDGIIYVSGSGSTTGDASGTSWKTRVMDLAGGVENSSENRPRNIAMLYCIKY